MKRYGNLFPQVTAFENLLTAAKKAQKGKRYQKAVYSQLGGTFRTWGYLAITGKNF